MDGAGLGTEKPADLEKDDDEFEAYRKRMMLAYRFRPNPLVTNDRHCYFSFLFRVYFLVSHGDGLMAKINGHCTLSTWLSV